MKEEFKCQISPRFSPEPKGLAVQASVRDPRFRKLTFLNEHERTSAVEHLKATITENDDTTEEATSSRQT